MKKRLVFKLKEKEKEKGVLILYHRSIVDAIIATEPKGVMFTKVEDWGY